jgi:anti-sigma factor RsiW
VSRPPEDVLSAYLDGEATADERALVERELATSEEWRAVMTELRETRDLLRGLPVHDAPPGFWAGVLAGDAEQPVSRAVSPTPLDSRRRRRTRVAGWVAGAAAAAAIVAVVLVPQEDTVKPPVGTLVTSHAARSSLSAEPVSQLAPVATPVVIGR